ncbi:uncharacterized protein [Polyergus mexicanus]|uniref:uncharacterized protein n=1 Tax=Polyergus mexicanus TaxID=615972 RepID=UPI0038B4ACE6
MMKIEKCYKEYGLDPVYYISAPHFANDASLKYTEQTLELLSDREMYETYETGIRGGISMIPHRYALANNCYFYDNKIGKTVKLSKEKAIEKGIYNSKKHVSYILYLDANNLYGYALSQPLPIGEFKYEGVNDFTLETIKSLPYDGEYGYSFLVDLDIPLELHDKFKNYPMLPEHYVPSYDELSEYQKEMISKGIECYKNALIKE